MTSTFTVSETINRPVEEVFAFVSDARNNAQWQADTGFKWLKQTPEEPVGVGTRITEARSFMGRDIEATSEVTEYEPNHKYTRSAIGSSPLKQSTMTFEPVADGAQLTVVTQVEAGGLFAIAEPLLANAMKQGFEKSLASLKSLLERQPMSA